MNFLKYMTPVVKNLVILNVLLFVVKLIGKSQGFELDAYLGGYVFGSPLFQPFQLVTHFFMHGDFFHLLFNMIGLIFFGSMLERVWGEKRFFIFYFACGLGAFILYQAVGFYELSQYKQAILEDYNQNIFYELKDSIQFGIYHPGYTGALNGYEMLASVPMVGASGAVFGILAGAAYIFPNTQVQLLFPPIPIKIKWLAIIYIGFEIYSSIERNPGDNVAHFAHVTGALVGFIIVLFFQRNKKTFY